MSADATDDAPRKLEISPVQIAASALAAVSAAFFASWAGTAGTLIGAAAGSLIATVGAATYSYSLRRTSDIAKRTAAQVREGALLAGNLPRPRPRTRRAEDAPEAAAAREADEKVAWWHRFDPRGLGLPWGKVALASAGVLLLALVVITSFEGATGKSVSDFTRGSSEQSSTTTVGNLFGGDGADQGTDEDGDQPQDNQGPAQDDGTDPTQAPDDGTDPQQEPSPEPTDDASEDVDPEPAPEPAPTQAPAPAEPPAGSQPQPSAPALP